MNKQEFKKFWDECIEPTFKEMSQSDSTLYIRDGSFDSLCRHYNDTKNSIKRLFMKSSGDTVKLDRHKIAACMAKAIVTDRPICKKIEEDFTGKETEAVIANEALAFSVAIAILEAYIKLKLEKKDPAFMTREKAYRKMCESGFAFPKTIMGVDYATSVCWAWYHNALSGHFDVLGTANLFFMIENYSVEVYDK